MYSTKNHFILSVEEILKRISEQNIFKYYIKSYDGTTTKFISEIRKESNPSCSIKQLQSGRWIYKDFGSGDTCTCFDYVQYKFGLNFYYSLKLIAKDFNLQDYKVTKNEKKIEIKNNYKEEQVSRIRIVPIDNPNKYTIKGLEYWRQYNIKQNLLELYKVKEISHYYINDNLITIPKLERGFAYCFGYKEKRYLYKILRPFNQNWKWISNCNSSIIQGYKQLPEKGDLLFLTSSLKDVMALRSIEFYSAASQSENTTISDKLIEEFKERFNKVVLFLNNDLAGLKAAEYQSKLYNIPYTHFCICQPKDPADFIKEKGVEETIKMINKMILGIR